MGSVPVVDELELETQVATLLPRRETLYSFGGVNVTVAPVVGVNLAFAVNAATINSNASAFAAQTLAVYLP
jgi:hypothetical protein